MKADFNVLWNIRFDFGCIIKRWVETQAATLKANHLRGIRLRKELVLLEMKIGLDSEGDAPGTPHPLLGDRLARRDRKRELDRLESVEHFTIGDYKVLYIPKKGFRLTRQHKKRGRNSVTFFDAMGWYATGIGEAAPLEQTSAKHLGDHKTAAQEGIDVHALGSTPGYYAAHRHAILRYCIQDCNLTARLFAKTIQSFANIGIDFPDEPWSRASVGRHYLKQTGVLEATREQYAHLKKTGHARLWEAAYAGACILTRGVGTWTGIAKFDLNSAYPAPMPDFPSLEGAYLVGPEDPEFSSCVFRFYEVEMEPSPRRALKAKGGTESHLLYHQGGEPRRVCVTHLDLEAFDAWGDRYTIVAAVGVVTPSRDVHPLDYMAHLFQRKAEIKEEFGEDSVEYQNIKIMLNGTYGILTQSRPRPGRFTNYIYGAYITAWTRRALWLKAKELEAQGGTVLAFQTDGLLVADLAETPPSSKNLGAWEVKDVGMVTLFANGIYVLGGKLKKRGAPDLNVDALLNCGRPWVHTTRSGPLGLKPAIIQGRPEAIGVWEVEERDLVPWRMLEDSGLRMAPELRSAPLRDFFTRRWFLDYRTATEARSPRSVLAIVEGQGA